jgi:hypothetical protein
MSNIRDGQNQAFRFPSNEVMVYDTDARWGIRSRLWDLAKDAVSTAMSRSAPSSQVHKAFVTGVGGNGKSHNLALFVHQAREAGALVVYAHDAQQFVEKPQYLFENCIFGVRLWAATAHKASPLSRALTATHDATRQPTGTDVLLRVDPDEALLGALCSTLIELNNDGTDQRFLKSTNEVRKLYNICTRAGVPLILVMDQDNRLNRTRPPLLDDREFLLQAFPAHLKVLGASANNEGWERRNWDNRIEHYPEPVPKNSSKELFPTLAGAPDLTDILETEFEGFPLAFNLAEAELLKRDPSEAVDVRQIVDNIRRSLFAKASHYFEAVKRDQKVFQLSQSHEALREGYEKKPLPLLPVYDRNFCYLDRKGKLRPIFREFLTWQQEFLEGFHQQTLGAVSLSPSMQYEQDFAAACNFLLAPVGKPLFFLRLRCSCLQREDIAEWNNTASGRDVALFAPPPRAQGYDFISVRWEKGELYFYQLTLNTTHKDMVKEVGETERPFLNNSTILGECLHVLQNGGFTVQRVFFVYVSPEAISIERPRDSTTKHENSPKVAAFDDYQGTQLQLLCEASSNKHNLVKIGKQQTLHSVSCTTFFVEGIQQQRLTVLAKDGDSIVQNWLVTDGKVTFGVKPEKPVVWSLKKAIKDYKPSLAQLDPDSVIIEDPTTGLVLGDEDTLVRGVQYHFELP